MLRRISQSRAFTILIFVVAAATCARILVRAGLHWQIDLDVYRLGGKAIIEQLPLYGDGAPTTGLPFTYTPLAALLFVPLAILPHTAAQLVWTALLLASLTAFIWLAVDYAAPKLKRNNKVLIAAAVLGIALWLEPIRHNFGLGQINLLLATMILADLRHKTGRIPHGMLIGLAAAIKLTPLIFVAYLLFAGRRRDAFTAIATALGATLLAAAAVWDSSWEYWTKLAFDASHVGGIPYVANQSMYGVLTRLLEGTENADAIFKPLAIVVGLIGLTLAVRARRQGQPMLGDILCALTGLLLSPISWSHHWVWIVPAMIWLSLNDRAPRWGRPATVGGIVLFALGPIWWVPREHDVEFLHHGWQLLAANSYLLVAVAFLLAVFVHRLRADPVSTGKARISYK